MDYIRISEFLKSLRKAKGLTQQAVADELYVNSKTISKWENGDSIPDISIIENVALFYGVTVDEILKGRRSDGSNVNENNNKTEKIIANSIKRKYAIYFYVSLGILGVFFLSSLIFYACNELIVSLVLYVLGLVLSLLVIILGNQLCYQEIDDYDDELIKKGYLKAKKSIVINNKLYTDVYFILIFILVGVYLLNSELSFFVIDFLNTSIFEVMVPCEVIIGLVLMILQYSYLRKYFFNGYDFDKFKTNILIISVLISIFFILFGVRNYIIKGFDPTISNEILLQSIEIENGILFIYKDFFNWALIVTLSQVPFVIGSLISIKCKKTIPVLVNLLIIIISSVIFQSTETRDYFTLAPTGIVIVVINVCLICCLLYLEKNIHFRLQK